MSERDEKDDHALVGDDAHGGRGDLAPAAPPQLPHAATMHEHHCGGSSWFGNWSNGGRCQWCGAVLPIAFGTGNQASSDALGSLRSAAPK